MTTLDTLQEPGAPEIPRGAYETFLAVGALAAAGMIAFVFLYGMFGRKLTAGLDNACAEASFEYGKKLEGEHNYDGAIQRYRQAMEGHFRHPEQMYMCGRSIGDLLLQERRYSEAIDAYRQLPADAFSTAGSYTGYVNALWRDGRLQEAEHLGRDWLQKAQAENNQEQILWANDILMRVCDATARPDEALQYGRTIVAADPSNEARLLMAHILKKQGNTAEALEETQQFIKLSSNPKLLEEARQLEAELKAAR